MVRLECLTDRVVRPFDVFVAIVDHLEDGFVIETDGVVFTPADEFLGSRVNELNHSLFVECQYAISDGGYDNLGFAGYGALCRCIVEIAVILLVTCWLAPAQYPHKHWRCRYERGDDYHRAIEHLLIPVPAKEPS